MTTPTDQNLFNAEAMLREAADYAYRFAINRQERDWNKLTGHLQDALAELGREMRELKTPAPATAEALFDDAAYSHSRGGM